jgi:hypothetical protein
MHVAAPDPRIDLSLRFLSLLVSGVIASALAWYLFVLIEPWIDLQRWQGDTPIIELDPLSTLGPRLSGDADESFPPASARCANALGSGPVQLFAPAFTVFRCELRGRVTYADQPCERGGMRVLRLPRN